MFNETIYIQIEEVIHTQVLLSPDKILFRTLFGQYNNGCTLLSQIFHRTKNGAVQCFEQYTLTLIFSENRTKLCPLHIM